MSDSPIRLAIIGRTRSHAFWRDLNIRLQRCRFTILVDRHRDSGAARAEVIGVARAVESLDIALSDYGSEFDAVVFPLALRHEQLAVQAADAGKHVLLAAPFAKSAATIQEIVTACDRAGVCCAVKDSLRFAPDTQAVKSRISDGNLGQPGLLRVHRWRPKAAGSVAATIFRDIDLAQWLFDAIPSDVFALGRGGGKEGKSPDYLQVHLGFDGGGMAVLDFSSTLPDGEAYDSWSLISSTGAAYSDDHRNTHLLYGGGNPAALISRKGCGHVLAEYQAFVDSIADRSPTESLSGKDCLAAHRVIEAVQQSLASGQAVQLGGDHGP